MQKIDSLGFRGFKNFDLTKYLDPKSLGVIKPELKTEFNKLYSELGNGTLKFKGECSTREVIPKIGGMMVYAAPSDKSNQLGSLKYLYKSVASEDTLKLFFVSLSGVQSQFNPNLLMQSCIPQNNILALQQIVAKSGEWSDLCPLI